jgi:hypothetical protein
MIPYCPKRKNLGKRRRDFFGTHNFEEVRKVVSTW